MKTDSQPHLCEKHLAPYVAGVTNVRADHRVVVGNDLRSNPKDPLELNCVVCGGSSMFFLDLGAVTRSEAVGGSK